GVTVDVTWVETMEDPDDDLVCVPPLSLSLQASAQAADTACKKLGIIRDKVPTLPETTIFDAIQTFHFAVDVMAIRRVLNYVRTYENAVAQIESTVNTLKSPVHTWPAMYALELVEEGLLELLEQAEQPARPVTSFLLDRPTTLDAFARAIGNTVAEVV